MLWRKSCLLHDLLCHHDVIHGVVLLDEHHDNFVTDISNAFREQALVDRPRPQKPTSRFLGLRFCRCRQSPMTRII